MTRYSVRMYVRAIEARIYGPGLTDDEGQVGGRGTPHLGWHSKDSRSAANVLRVNLHPQWRMSPTW